MQLGFQELNDFAGMKGELFSRNGVSGGLGMDTRGNGDKNVTPEDVASLYSWANLHGAKYRDFSVSRAQTREKARLRVQQAIEEERRRVREEVEQNRQNEELQAAIEAAEPEVAAPVAEQPRSARSVSSDLPVIEAPVVKKSVPVAAVRAELPAAPGAERAAMQPVPQDVKQSDLPVRLPLRYEEKQRSAVASVASQVEQSGDAQHVSRGSRWLALNSALDHPEPRRSVAASKGWRVPVLAVFSLAGGVGKTSLVATLGRALSAEGEQVLLVDTSSYGLLPYYFGARDQRPGTLRTFTPPGSSDSTPLQMLEVEPELPGTEDGSHDALVQLIQRSTGTAQRVIVDLATASGSTMRRIAALTPTVLVPVVPDLNSVVSVGAIEAFFQNISGAFARPIAPYYVLTQFDASLPLHQDVQELLEEQLGDRLLSVVLRREQSLSEALAEGMTVMDYAPSSAAAMDFLHLADWLKDLSPPAVGKYRGLRWSER